MLVTEAGSLELWRSEKNWLIHTVTCLLLFEIGDVSIVNTHVFLYKNQQFLVLKSQDCLACAHSEFINDLELLKVTNDVTVLVSSPESR